MILPRFNNIKELSNIEIYKAIIKNEKDLFELRFKRATRRPFKPHKIKHTKRNLAQLKTLLTLRLEILNSGTDNTSTKVFQK